ncbi:anthrone oxygenase family protein [Ferruginibacter sp.]|jgi:uncharacterized membrane protein
MIFNFSNTILFFTALFTALMAGLFYSWSCSVTLGLSKLTDREYISAMQYLNREIQNPVFFISFFGAAILLPICSYMQYNQLLTAKFYLILSATIIYLAGVMAVTILGNIPLNQTLDKFNLTNATLAEIAKQRIAFEVKWNNLNMIRTVASIFSLILILIACICKTNK